MTRKEFLERLKEEGVLPKDIVPFSQRITEGGYEILFHRLFLPILIFITLMTGIASIFIGEFSTYLAPLISFVSVTVALRSVRMAERSRMLDLESKRPFMTIKNPVNVVRNPDDSNFVGFNFIVENRGVHPASCLQFMFSIHDEGMKPLHGINQALAHPILQGDPQTFVIDPFDFSKSGLFEKYIVSILMIYRDEFTDDRYVQPVMFDLSNPGSRQPSITYGSRKNLDDFVIWIRESTESGVDTLKKSNVLPI